MEEKQGRGRGVSPSQGAEADGLPGPPHMIGALKAVDEEVRQSFGKGGEKGLEAGGRGREIETWGWGCFMKSEKYADWP